MLHLRELRVLCCVVCLERQRGCGKIGLWFGQVRQRRHCPHHRLSQVLTSFCHCSFCLRALCSKLISIRICSCQHDSLPVCSSAHFLFHLPAPMSLLFWSPFCIPLFHPPFVLPPHKRGTLVSASAPARVEQPRRPFPGVRFSLFFSFNYFSGVDDDDKENHSTRILDNIEP